MTRIIHIAGNSGSGKSVLAINLGMSLAAKNRDVILVDANIYSPDISNYADLVPLFFLNDYLDGHKKLDEVITHHHSGLRMIASIAEDNHNPAKHKKINEALLHLIGKAEIVIVDSFSHNPAMHSIMSNSDETIFITNDDYPGILKAKEQIKKLEYKGMNVIGIVLNRRMPHASKKHVEMIVDKKVIAEIPHDENVVISINKKKPAIIYFPKSKFSKSVDELSELLNL